MIKLLVLLFIFKNYGFYVRHYLSAQALSWDVMLNITKVELELISDSGMYLLFEKSKRGSVSYICQRYSQASNKYLKSYDQNVLFTWMRTTYIAMECLNLFQLVNSNGLILKILT